MMGLNDKWRSAPVISRDHVVHHIDNDRGDGGFDEVLIFTGTYHDARDNEIARRICAIPELVSASAHAVRCIEALHLQSGNTGSGNTVITKLNASIKRAVIRVHNEREVLVTAEGRSVDDVFHQLALISEDVENVLRDAALQIEYLLEKFGRPEGERKHLEPIQAALNKAKSGEFFFKTDTDRDEFVQWTELSRELILLGIPYFSRCGV